MVSLKVFKASAKTKEELRESSAAFRRFMCTPLSAPTRWDAPSCHTLSSSHWGMASEGKASGKDAVAERVVTGFILTTVDPR